VAGDERLRKWWDGLNPDMRAEAQQARKKGRLTPRIRKSLQDAGVEVDPVEPTVPSDVTEFLKMRH